MTTPPNRSAEQLAEVLAALAASSTEAAAIQGAIERIAESFDSEAAAVVKAGVIVASIGFGRDQALPPALIDVASGIASEVVVPGAGRCRAVVVPVPSEPPCRLVLARSGDEGFSVEEVSLLRSMGRIVATALDMLYLRDRVADSEVRFRRIVETANEGIWLLDVDGGTTFANGKVAEILGFPPDEMASLTIFDVVDDQGKPHVARNLERRRQGVSDQLECAFLRKDGSYVWVLLHASPILDGDGTYAGSLCMVSDISGRKRIETELASARDAAMEASRLKSDFLATMSHEIRTPMNGVIGLTGLLLTTQLDDRQRQYARGVQTAGEALLGIINDILDFSKIEAGRLELEVIDFDLVQVVEEAAALVAESAQSKGLELLVSCAPDLPATVRGDPARLRQVLLNLASNAVKFTADGEVVVRVGIESEVGEVVSVGFEVIDTGIGISEADGHRLFEPFSQADASTTRRFGGTGLGLAISRRLVTAMDGDLEFESLPGRGSTFRFTLPLERRAGTVAAGRLPAHPAPGLRVLVVDDNETNREVLAARLRAWGLACDLAPDGPSALARLRAAAGDRRLPDVVLVDGYMPGMDGFELSRRISSDPGLTGVRLVMLTSAAGIGAAESRRAGIEACLTKPVRLSQLAAALAAPGANPTELAVPVSAPPPGSAGHVLVVDDNANNQLVALGILRLLGYRAEVAANGYEALAAIDRADYDAILMDCQMPEMDGFTATAEIRRRQGPGRRTPVIAMTAGASDADRERCLAAGMDAFLSKPVRPGDVGAALAHWIAGRAGPEIPPLAPAAGEAPALDNLLDDDLLEELREIDPDGGLLTRIVVSFLDGTPGHLVALRALVADGDAAAVRQAAHRLRGSSGNVGALHVTALLAELEEDSVKGRLDRAPDLLCDIERAFDQAAAVLVERCAPGHPVPAATQRGAAEPPTTSPTTSHYRDGPLERLPEPALQVDAEGRLVDANRLARAMCATTRTGSAEAMAAAVGTVRGFSDWLGGLGVDAFHGHLSCQRDNGVPLTLEVSAGRVPDGAGGATCLLLEFNRDRVATEAQRYFDVAFDAAPVGMALFNTDGEYVRVNRALCALLGRSEAQLLGRRDQEFTHPDDRQRDVDAAWRILRGEISTWQTEKRFVRPNGSVVWAIANLTFLRDDNGNPVSWVGQFQDITARHGMEADTNPRSTSCPVP
ncbi:MAG: two-component system, sensor histidine kinase and response regulator [Actinomycetota bacterium]|nr:two-component system, sensor histidine kinase and response regulator [Actinomycetota bacterium]